MRTVVHPMIAMIALALQAAQAACASEAPAAGGPAAQASVPAVTSSGYAMVNGLRMYYEIRGTGSPGVFIHPMASQGAMARQLTANREWITMDLQGHGRTADIDRPINCEQDADDIAALLAFLKVDQADVFGDSFGGSIAMTLAVRHPELVRRVVSYGSPLAPIPADAVPSLTPDADQFRWERESYQRVAPDPAHWPRFFAKVLACGTQWRGLSPAELAAITAPVLIMCGDHDLIPVERCAELERLIPHAQLAVIPDASHFVLFSDPGRVLPTIAAFLDAPAPSAPLSTFRTGYYPGVTR